MSIYNNKAIEDAVKKMEQEQNKKNQEAINIYNNSFSSAIDNANSQYASTLRDTDQQYDDLLRSNAVQKEIDKRNIEETMANMGMTNSGLNRTQQTAAQLRYSNNNAQYMRQLQSAKDKLSLSLREYLSGIDQQKSQYAAGLKTQAADNITSYKAQLYQNAQDNETAQKKAQYDYNYKVQQAQISAQKEAAAAAEKQSASKSENKLSYANTKEVWDNLRSYQKAGNKDAASAYLLRLVRSGYIGEELAASWYDEYFKDESIDSSSGLPNSKSSVKVNQGSGTGKMLRTYR